MWEEEVYIHCVLEILNNIFRLCYESIWTTRILFVTHLHYKLGLFVSVWSAITSYLVWICIRVSGNGIRIYKAFGVYPLSFVFLVKDLEMDWNIKYPQIVGSSTVLSVKSLVIQWHYIFFFTGRIKIQTSPSHYCNYRIIKIIIIIIQYT